MAITRRQFVTRLGALAAAVGMSQTEVAKIAETFAFGPDPKTDLGGTLGKPRVVWIHGAECTGCSTSLLSVFEDADGEAIVGSGVDTATAAGMAGILPTQLGGDNFTYHALGYNVDGAAINIADIVVDVVDLQYHETIMGMGGDLAAQWLEDFKTSEFNDGTFVLVVEGALQDHTGGGAWDDSTPASKEISWCSIGMSADGVIDHDMAETVVALAIKDNCKAVIPIGQCATFGGYPGCKPPLDADPDSPNYCGFKADQSQTGARGTWDYLVNVAGQEDAAKKVINVPGCPTNPWWFVLTVVMLLVDLVDSSHPLGVLDAEGLPAEAAIDKDHRLKAVYGTPIHGPYCYRYRDYVQGVFAAKPGDPGCLQKIGCKGPAANSLCGVHGWNGQQPQNHSDLYGTAAKDVSIVNPAPNGTTKTGGHCTRAGHPCMACTEKGYPDAFVPFIARS